MDGASDKAFDIPRHRLRSKCLQVHVSPWHEVFSVLVSSTTAMFLTLRSALAAAAAQVERTVLPQRLHHPLRGPCMPDTCGGCGVGEVIGMYFSNSMGVTVESD